MSQATGYTASNEVPFVVPIRFATPVVFPLLRPPLSFKRGGHQEPFSRNAQVGSLHPSMSGEPETHPAHTATATTSMLHQNLVVEPPPSGRELRPRSRLNPSCAGHVQHATQPAAKKSHARRQPEGHIPRPRNAFILFRCDFVAQKKIPASVEPDHRNISRIVGRVWKAMSDEERRPWLEEAKKERETHKRLYPQYRYSPLSTAEGTTGTSMRTKRAQNKKMRESMGVLPAWEITRPRSATETSCLRNGRASEPTEEQQRQEDPQEEALLQPRTQRIVAGGSWSTVPDSGGEGGVASHADRPRSPADWELPSHQSWEFPGEEPQHRSPRDGAAVAVGSIPVRYLTFPFVYFQSTCSRSLQGRLNAPSPFETPTASSHFDSPDPTPMESTLSPFMFVARHYAINNPEFSGFHFAPDPEEAPVGAAVPFADALVSNDPVGQFQQLQTGHKAGSENFLENFPWTTEHIDGIMQNMQSGPSRPSFDFVEPFVNF